MSKVMKIKVIEIKDFIPANSRYNHSNYDKITILISALDADRVQINGYRIDRKNSQHVCFLNREDELFTIYSKPIGNGVHEFKNNVIKIKPYYVLYYVHQKDGKKILTQKYQRAVLVEEDN